MPTGQLVHLQHLRKRIEKPEMRNARSSVRGQFFRAIVSGRRRRENLADPIRPDGKSSFPRKSRQTFAPPARQIRDEHVFAEPELGLIESPPSARTAIAELERRNQHRTEGRRSNGMRRGWSRTDDEFTRDDLADEMLGQPKNVCLRRATAGTLHHGTSVARSFATAT